MAERMGREKCCVILQNNEASGANDKADNSDKLTGTGNKRRKGEGRAAGNGKQGKKENEEKERGT